MKYIRLFEYTNYKYTGDFYFIPYDNLDLILMAIDHIDTTDKIKKILQDSISYSLEHLINNALGNNINRLKNMLGVFIGVTDYNTSEQFWICIDKEDKEGGYRSFIRDKMINYTYRGVIELEDWEIASNKYNL